MYTEEYEAKGFPLRSFLLKLIFVLIFVFLLIWLIPKATTQKLENKNDTDLSPTSHDEVFAENLEKMQKVAVDYYQKDRLPQTVGSSDKMTLSSMIQKKLIVPLVDHQNNKCDVHKSYVKVTKLDQEYLMKINLKCKKEEDYILVHMGDYSYCDGDICPKKDTEILEEESNPVEEVDFGKNYSSSQGENISSDDSNISDVTVEEPEVSVPVHTPGYLYEYQKTTGAKYSDWSKWSAWSRTSCNTVAYGCNDSNPSCMKKLQVYKRKEQIGTYDKEYVAGRVEFKQAGDYSQQVCANYDYISYNNQLYVLTAPYTTINYVTSATRSSVNGWKYEGRKSFSEVPSDTLTTRYKFVEADFSGCSSTCTVAPKRVYDVYRYTGEIGVVGSATGSQNVTTLNNKIIKVNCVGSTKKTIPIYGSITTYEKALRKEALYGTVCYQSTKTRSVLDKGNTDTKWSGYNDSSLLNKGYQYTGNKKQG